MQNSATYICRKKYAVNYTKHWDMYNGKWRIMAKKALHKCSKFGCNRLTADTYCEEHKSLKTSYDLRRDNANSRGYNTRWQKARRIYLNNHPFCKRCLDSGIYTPATVVDHIIPHKGDKDLFWEQSNWQPLCKRCHDRKTATEDGGFGRG